MELLNKPKKKDIYSEEVEVKLTVGELMILKHLTGQTNSHEVSKGFRVGHNEFADRIENKRLNKYLFQDLSYIVKEVMQ